MTAIFLLWLIPILPFAGFLINGTLGRRLPKVIVTAIALLAPLGSFVCVLGNAFGMFGDMPVPAPLPVVQTYGSWINAGLLHVDFSLVLDQLSLVMLLIITGVGLLIHIYSAGYMEHEDGYWRYFAYLNLFLFFMTVLVLAGNALLMFVGWEGVGLASYLLIGFWFQKTTAADAARKRSSSTALATLAF
jgi:NADH-quinone oxidoreductase subunit L